MGESQSSNGIIRHKGHVAQEANRQNHQQGASMAHQILRRCSGVQDCCSPVVSVPANTL
jgi:hypothetical protein